MPYLLYLHGFNSAPQSLKAQQASQYFAEHWPRVPLQVPALNVSPHLAMQSIYHLLEQAQTYCAGVIGSSLGGYYALHLYAKFGLPAVLINPAIYPYRRLREYLGENTNYYTGERYQVLPQHMQELQDLQLPLRVDPARLYLLTQTHDETLDWREAIEHLAGAKVWAQFGGSHAFDDFDATLPSIADFLLSSH